MTTSNVLTFNNRETYLEFRMNWKAEYKQVSIDIREAKNTIKSTQRESSQTSYLVYSRLRTSQKRANELLEILVEAKKRAQQQYLEKHKELEYVCN